MTSWKKFGLLIKAGLCAISFSLALVSPSQADDFPQDNDLPKKHALHMFDGEPLYPVDFPHWSYVNPDAPRGGSIRIASRGSFDTLNNMNGKGDTARGLARLYNSLLVANRSGYAQYASDELDTYYGELAEWMQMSEDRSRIIFKIRDEAKWSDGVPITPQDVIFTWEKQRKEGFEGFATAYTDLLSIEDLGGNRVKFVFDPKADNQQRFAVVGGEEIIPKHYWESRDFSKTTQEVPLGSGPFRIADFDLGNFIEYEFRDDYWAKDLPFHQGLNNISTVRYDMYREVDVMRNALKAGKVDFRVENTAKAWATFYEDMQPTIDAGVFHKLKEDEPGMQAAQAFFFNVQLEKFQNRDVRHALALTFDFEWANKTVFYNQYVRLNSHFEGSPLQAKGKPEGLELEILENFRGQVPDEVFGEAYRYPETDGSGNNRQNLRKALQLLKKAGYNLKEGKLLNASGQQLAIEFIGYTPASSSFLVPWMDNMKKIGIDANLRVMEPNQWFEKIRERDFEMMGYVYTYGYNPGTAVDYKWSSRLAATKGSIAVHGVENPVLDELAKMLIQADSREKVNATARALDRVLTHEHYLILEWSAPFTRILFWDKFGRPTTKPVYGSEPLSTWWVDPEKAATLEQRRKALKIASK